DNDKINSDEINSHVESNSDESTSNYDTDDDSEEVDAVGDLHVDNFIQNSEHEYSENEDSDFVNPLLPLPPSEPPDKEFNFEKEILVVRNAIVKFECIDAKEFSLLFTESEDTIFDLGISD
nr:hypothetical protein [Tanacetum cinerariifolium]